MTIGQYIDRQLLTKEVATWTIFPDGRTNEILHRVPPEAPATTSKSIDFCTRRHLAPVHLEGTIPNTFMQAGPHSDYGSSDQTYLSWPTPWHMRNWLYPNHSEIPWRLLTKAVVTRIDYPDGGTSEIVHRLSPDLAVTTKESPDLCTWRLIWLVFFGGKNLQGNHASRPLIQTLVQAINITVLDHTSKHTKSIVS